MLLVFFIDDIFEFTLVVEVGVCLEQLKLATLCEAKYVPVACSRGGPTGMVKKPVINAL